MADIGRTPFVRDLASSDRKTRDKALDSLTLFLRSKTNLSLIDLLKLWKGLFFCFYHSDRPLTQQALARSLSYSLVPTLPRSTLHRFLRAFWITIGREFHSIDRLRLDKYMFLIRCYVGVAFEVFVKGTQQPKLGDSKGSGKKRKREEEAAAATAAAAATTTKGGKKQSKRSKGKKHADGDEAEQTSSTGANGSQNNTPTTNEGNDENDSTENNSKWADLDSYLSIIEEGPLNPLNFDPDQPSDVDEKTDYVPMPHGPDGLRYHIMDLWIDELEKVIDFEESPDNDENVEGGEEEEDDEDYDGAPKFASRKIMSDVPMDILLRPIETLRAKGLHKPVRIRAVEALDDDRLVEWGVKERKVDNAEEDEDGSDEEWGGFGDE